jgi:hypothetical protein
MLKKLMTGLAVAGLLATPAVAQKYDPALGSGNIVQGPGGAPTTGSTPPYVGQRSGEAYNYDKPSTTGQATRHEKKRKITPQHD